MEESKQRNEIEGMKNRGNFFMRLVYLVLGIRIPGKRGRALAAIAKSMRKAGFNYYNFRSGKVTGQFAELVYGVYKAVSPFKNFFQSAGDNERLKQELIRCSLTEAQKKDLERFGAPAIHAASERIRYNELVNGLRDSYIEFQKQFNAASVTNIDEVYNGVVVLRSFCTLDYYFMLKKFCPSLVEDSFDDKARFAPVAGDYVADEVIDFAAAAKPLLAVRSWPAVFAFLNELPGHLEVDEESFNAMVSSLKRLDDADVLLKLARLLQSDNKFEVPANEKKAEIVKPYLENLYASMKDALQTLFNEQKQKHIEAMVRKVFPEGYSFTFTFYNKDESTKYESCGTEPYTWYEPLEYLRGYLALIVKEQMHEFVEVFAVRGKPLVNNGVSDVTVQYHDLLDALNAIQGFDQKLDTKFPEGYKIKSLYDTITTDPDAQMKLSGEITMVNTEAGALLHKTVSKVNELFKSIFELKNDCSREVSEMIDNWGEISRYLSSPAKELLDSFYLKTSEFLKLMSDFGL